tara:strand:+ start:56 stop:478 length:423 start_codon:yes stop_codon:yes gene_type:complete
MDVNFYNKCCKANAKINEVYIHLENSNIKGIIRELKNIRNIRIIHTYINSINNDTKKDICVYPGCSIELVLVNNLIIEISCPPEKNKDNLYIEIDIINEITRKRLKDKYKYIFPFVLHKIEDLMKNLQELSLSNISIIKN